MTTIVIVKKGNQAAIASDSQSTFGDSFKLTAGYNENHEKIFQISDNFIGVSGYCAHFLAYKQVLSGLKKLELSSRTAIFNTLLKIQKSLKDRFFLCPEKSSYPYEHNDICMLLANPSGIFEISSMREVTEFSRFWAIGTGAENAKGAMFAYYDQDNMNAEDIALMGVRAGCEFDAYSNLPILSNVVTLNRP